MKLNLRGVAATGLCSFLILIGGITDANATGPVLWADVGITDMLSQRYSVTYFSGSSWLPLSGRGGNVTLGPRFSAGQSSKYAIEIKDKNDTNSRFFLYLATSGEPCFVHQTSKDAFFNETVGNIYEITTQYTKLSTTSVQNANVSVAYRVCTKQNVISIRLFDPITSGIPIGIGAHVDNQSIRVSETYIVLNTEGILYPQ